MEDDPDETGYRYPAVGERFWHWRQKVWCTVEANTDYPMKHMKALGEVAVRLDDGHRAIVKLHNLVETPPADELDRGEG